MSKLQIKENGECFVKAAEYMQRNATTDKDCVLKLVHGIVDNQLDGKPMSHAWIEIENRIVIDVSGKNLVQAFKSQYYGIGNVRNEVKYNLLEMQEKLVETEHYGHWDLPKNLR